MPFSRSWHRSKKALPGAAFAVHVEVARVRGNHDLRAEPLQHFHGRRFGTHLKGADHHIRPEFGIRIEQV